MALAAHGFASLNGGTTGGSRGETVAVSTGKELLAAIGQAGSSPLTIRVDGEITASNTGASQITLKDVHNLSIIGAGKGAEFDGIGFQVKDGSSNLIFQNLKIHDVRGGEGDAIGIEGGSHNIWIDHNEFYSSKSSSKDHYDGLVDTKRGSEYITISNNHFHDHHKASLNGFSDSDQGGRYVTYSGNVFENIGSRAPSVRDGEVHVYNNLYSDVSESAINIRMGAEALIENNVFTNVKNPIVSIDSDKIGFWNLNGNEFNNVTWGKTSGSEASAQDGKSTTDYDVPYAYKLASTASVKADALANAGVGKLDGSQDTGATPKPVTPPRPQPEPETPSDKDDDDSSKDETDSTNPDDSDSSPDDAAPTITATGRDDSLTGTSGDDVIAAKGGDDKVLAGDGDDMVTGGTGADRLEGGDGKDVLDGGNGQDTLLGGNGDDTLLGGNGKDTLLGGAGDDTLLGGNGKDILTGGAGADRFTFTDLADSKRGGSRDVITDFGDGDVIDLSALDAITGQNGDQDFTFLGSKAFTGKAGELHTIQSGDSTLVEGDVNGDGNADFQIELNGTHNLAASDFIL
ncbi:hypothetical protein [Roseomonas xinghualingensis]|uniref:pectate lyase family protein n=1 Tax=Roseomonas xinghualingensis TaxID=2986475 RepID=UPI0021F207B1|nr:hypothetical protein [Roseomonas sp. SXEYE001]MCV4209282.1 hypothetical protein [Roseomonas sp. SXEYE001]